MEEKVIGEKKPLNKKLIIGIVAAVIVVLAIILVIVFMGKGKEDADKGTKSNAPTANTQEKIVEEVELNGLRFSNIAMITEGTTTYLTMDVTNPTNNTIKMETVDIDMKDKDGNVITTFLGYFGGEVPAGETRTISSQVEMDLSKAVTKEIKVTQPKQ